jgi:hypothetical protein
MCAHHPGAPDINDLRPRHCPRCGIAARTGIDEPLRIVGHGCYSRHIRGLTSISTTWIVIWVRRFICLSCRVTISVLPDILHPRRWYAAVVILEALWRNLILEESEHHVARRFRPETNEYGWLQLSRWRKQLLFSATLWGFMGRQLGVSQPALGFKEARRNLQQLLVTTSGSVPTEDSPQSQHIVWQAAQTSLNGIVHNREEAWLLRHDPPGRRGKKTSARSWSQRPTQRDCRSRSPP